HAEETPRKKDRLGEWMPARRLGRTGDDVTMLGMGGYHFGVGQDKDGQAILETALENGLRFVDCATEYQRGGSEERIGRILTPKYRDVVFLMTKAVGKDAKSVQKELEDSLRRMKTDYLDLWQVHSIESPEDVDARIENGVLDVFVKAKEEGKVRHIGFTGHRHYSAHLRMLERTQDSNIFETCQLPINVLDPSYNSFIIHVLPQLVERQIGVIAMKTLACGRFLDKNLHIGGPSKEVDTKDQLVPGRISLQEALHFVWSLPVSVIVSGMMSASEAKENCALAKSWTAIDTAQREAMIAKVADMAGTQIEWYKV
ncbi:MAG: aldo/keto reductase, partial [bacterium]|nr:aldo/keto reductase [bacterium]